LEVEKLQGPRAGGIQIGNDRWSFLRAFVLQAFLVTALKRLKLLDSVQNLSKILSRSISSSHKPKKPSVLSFFIQNFQKPKFHHSKESEQH
jgi:hypothetical protein